MWGIPATSVLLGQKLAEFAVALDACAQLSHDLGSRLLLAALLQVGPHGVFQYGLEVPAFGFGQGTELLKELTVVDGTEGAMR